VQTLPPILVAEDDDDDFHFLRRAARDAGVDNPLLRFRDGAELVKFLESLPEADPPAHAPWLLLLDIGMPIMNGFEVLQWLQDHNHLTQVRPVILSGFYREADINRSKTLGAIEYVIKPIRAETMATLARRTLEAAA
jgi:chemotaxis family two-component system response regulator Rcp1